MNIQVSSGYKANTSYNLNQGQQDAADKLMEFLLSDDKEFIISGPAGVGKTYMMKYIVDTAMPRYMELCALIGVEPKYREIHLTATTNKAAEVLQNAIGKPVGTIHSHFNLKLQDDFSSGKTHLVKNRQWKIHTNQVIIIDESSLIDRDLWAVLQEGTMDCKLIYVGDRHQLAPVHETVSPIYLHNNPMAELLEPMRNSGQPALMNVCSQLRKVVETGEFTPIQIVPGVIDYCDGPTMEAKVYEYFHKQTHDARILAWSNNRVLQYAEHVRTIRKLPDSYQPGELLVAANAVHTSSGIISVETEVEVNRNYGASVVHVETTDGTGVDIDVDYLEIKIGMTYFDKIPVPTNRQHFQEVVKYLGRTKQWSEYFMLKNQFADFRPRDAATVHKAQGSTYQTVFIDLGNISTCNIKNDVARMLYVAFSRAKTRIYLYGELASKYGGLIH